MKKGYAFYLFITLMLLLLLVSMVNASDVVDNSTDVSSTLTILMI